MCIPLGDERDRVVLVVEQPKHGPTPASTGHAFSPRRSRLSRSGFDSFSVAVRYTTGNAGRVLRVGEDDAVVAPRAAAAAKRRPSASRRRRRRRGAPPPPGLRRRAPPPPKSPARASTLAARPARARACSLGVAAARATSAQRVRWRRGAARASAARSSSVPLARCLGGDVFCVGVVDGLEVDVIVPRRGIPQISASARHRAAELLRDRYATSPRDA